MTSHQLFSNHVIVVVHFETFSIPSGFIINFGKKSPNFKEFDQNRVKKENINKLAK